MRLCDGWREGWLSLAAPLLALVVGGGVGLLLWPLVEYVPARLQADWRAAAQAELGLPGTQGLEPRVCWRRPAGRRQRWARVGFILLLSLLFGILVWRFGLTEEVLWGGVLTAYLLLLASIDAQTRLLPDALTLSCLWLGLLAHLSMGAEGALGTGVVGAVSGYGVLWAVAWVFKRCTGQDGMGHGDFKLFAALGAWLGFAALPWVLFLAASLGVLWAWATGRLRQALPFGPCLAISGWLVWVWGRPFFYG